MNNVEIKMSKIKMSKRKNVESKNVDNIGLVRNFLRFFRKFPGTAENALEYSILGVYIDGMNAVRMTIKLSKWKLISN